MFWPDNVLYIYDYYILIMILHGSLYYWYEFALIVHDTNEQRNWMS